MITTRTAAATDNAVLETKAAHLKLTEVKNDGAFEGYASVFGVEDLGHDIVEPGAFRETLARRKESGIRLLFQHDPAQPIGVWQRIYEDARGLFARGRITPAVGRAREILALMKDGAIDGLSIGFRPTRYVRDRKTGIRRLSGIDLWEISIVTFPMQPQARLNLAADPPRIDAGALEEARLLIRMADAARELRKFNSNRGH